MILHTWILLVWLTGHTSVTSHEFVGEEACKRALMAVKTEEGMFQTIRGVCVTRGDK